VRADYGDPKCKVCEGSGRLTVKRPGPPTFELCTCVLKHEILLNLDRGMHGLSRAGKVSSSPLLPYADKCLHVTARRDWFMEHLKYVGIRQGARWGFQVVSDADLMQAWLATAALQGHEIRDPDAAEGLSRPSLDYLTLVDIALPPTLLIIRVGVKTARNVAMPEVLLEAMRYRQHENKPTWIWDAPDYPLAEGHISWSPLVSEEMDGWRRVREGEELNDVPLAARSKAKARAKTGDTDKVDTSNAASVRNLWMKS
jgi:hypothetical protein